MSKLLTTKEIIEKYGTPNDEGTYLESITLPYPMRLAWDTKTIVARMRCHKLVKQNFLSVFNELLATYGLKKIQELGIDLFGGCFNFRKMRGGSDWSRHSWGIAIDLNPNANDLKTTYQKSLFSKPQYIELHRIFEKNGFLNLGKVKGYDTMHWEISG